MRGANKGFTLPELLVVIAILAILATIGLVLFQNVQKNSRDTKRKEDILAIAQALEGNRGNYYTHFQDSWFADGKVPNDPDPTRIYCVISNSANVTFNIPPASWIWTDGSKAPCRLDHYWDRIANGIMLDNTKSWMICAYMETTGNPFCVSNVIK